MLIGSARRDVTPAPGAQLSGYLYRVQPSTGVHDQLFVRALHIESEGERLLWLHADLIGLADSLVSEINDRAARCFGLEPRQIVISVTHTHAGPAAVPLILCGDCDGAYLGRLCDEFERAAESAIGSSEKVSLIAGEGHGNLAIDRRKKASAHADPRVGVLVWRRGDGSFAVVLANYAIHNVALSHQNRQNSADVAGAVARHLSGRLPGAPEVFFTAGAAANTNPPFSTTVFTQVDRWGSDLASVVEAALIDGLEMDSATLFSACTRFDVSLDEMSAERISSIASTASAAIVDDQSYEHHRYQQAVGIWRRQSLDRLASRTIATSSVVQLQPLRTGDVDLLCINAEIFSRFTDDLRAATGRRVYVVGYANGLIGYVPPAAACDEGGYEVDGAFIFYGGVRLARGGYEQILSRAVDLVLQRDRVTA